MEGLDQEIATIQRALDVAPEKHLDRAKHLNNLGIALQRRFEQTGLMEDLDQAIAMIQRALDIVPENHPNRPMCLSNLGSAYRRRFEQTGSTEDLDQAIAINQRALDIIPQNHPNRAMCLSNLGSALHHRFEQTGSMEDLNHGIAIDQQALDVTPENHPHHAKYLGNLGSALRRRFEQTGSIEDLDQAIAMNQQALDITPENDLDCATHLDNLGCVLYRRFEQTRSMEDLDQAIVMIHRALDVTPENDLHRAKYFDSLGSILGCRFEQTESMEDLDQATAMIQQALHITPENHPNHARYLSNLGSALRRRFEQTGSTEDLDQAIAMNQQAFDSTPENHPHRAIYLGNLGSALHRRFLQTGSMEDLDQTIATSHRALDITPENHPHQRAVYLGTLGIALRRRFERTGLMEDLDQAITMNQQALEVTPENHRDRVMFFGNLGNIFRHHFEQTQSMEDLDQAITMLQRALDVTPLQNRSNRARCLGNLGLALHRRFELTGLMEDRAITTIQQALDVIPENHPDRAIYLSNLGNLLYSRFQRTGSREDLDRAVGANEEAVGIVSAPPSSRIRAADAASRWLIKTAQLDRAKPLLKMAVELLPIITPHTLNPHDRQVALSQFSSITSRAVSVFIQCGETACSALQLSELGNSILANLQLQVRSDIVDLEESHPEIAQKFVRLREQLDPSGAKLPAHLADPDRNVHNDRREIAKRFDQLLAEIRKLPGFGDFLRVPSESALKELATSGPIVVFNVSEIRSDAIIVTLNDIRTIPLPKLQYTDLKSYTTQFLNATHTTGKRTQVEGRKKIHKVLQWLWDVAVERILDDIGFKDHNPCHWSRVYWVGSDLLNLLPIHAAGYHGSGPARTAIDRVISSYTPTLKALKYARERSERAAVGVLQQKVALIGWPDSKSKEDGLVFVSDDVEELNSLLSPFIQTTVLQAPDKNNVLANLGGYQVVHFSCHGYSSATDPSESRLLLKNWKTAPLTVADLTATNISHGQLAFLSACHSAALGESENPSLLSQSISLSSAIQLAGYPSVIGTLWKVMASESVAVAKEVYAGMLVGNDRLAYERSGEFLHHAVRSLRERTRNSKGFKGKTVSDDPLVWAPFIHIGV